MLDNGKFRLLSDGEFDANVRSGLHAYPEVIGRGVGVAFVYGTNPLRIRESARGATGASRLGGTLSSVGVFHCRRTWSPARSDATIVSPLRPGSTELRREARAGVHGTVESASQGAFEVEIVES